MPSVRAESSPYSLDFTIANAPSIVASVIKNEPNTSTPPARPIPSFSSINIQPSKNAITPIGTFTKKIQCQSSDWVSAPPASSPTEPPPAETNAYMPIALACSARLGNSVTMIARITLEATAPPTPWMMRETISIVWSWANPQSTDAAVNITSPVKKTFLRPTRSPIRPASSRKPPNVTR